MAVKKTIAIIQDYKILTENSETSRTLNKQGFGVLDSSKRIVLSAYEALYLVEKKKLTVVDSKNKEVKFDALFSKLKKGNKNFRTNYVVFKDLTSKGHIVKTGLKFGSDFRVYKKGTKPGKGHAKWIVYPVQENKTMTWHDFSAKNRVAHGTKKNLLIGVVDDEDSVTYWEVGWLKP
jgi:tRNA-intron endonuclease